MKLTQVLKETRFLNESGFTIQVRWPDPDGILVDKDIFPEAILAEFWTDTTLTSLLLQASETAIVSMKALNDKRLEKLVLSLKAAIEKLLKPVETIDHYATSPRDTDDIRMFPHPNSYFEFKFDRKIKKDEVRRIAELVAQNFQAYLPGLHVGKAAQDDLDEE